MTRRDDPEGGARGLCVHISLSLYVYIYIYMHIYIYIHKGIMYAYTYMHMWIMTRGVLVTSVGTPVWRHVQRRVERASQSPGRNWFGSIRFGSRLFFNNSSIRFGSVRTINFPVSTRFGLRFSGASWLSPVWFGLVPRPVPELNGSVRFASVSHSFLTKRSWTI